MMGQLLCPPYYPVIEHSLYPLRFGLPSKIRPISTMLVLQVNFDDERETKSNKFCVRHRAQILYKVQDTFPLRLSVPFHSCQT